MIIKVRVMFCYKSEEDWNWHRTHEDSWNTWQKSVSWAM